MCVKWAKTKLEGAGVGEFLYQNNVLESDQEKQVRFQQFEN